MNEGLLAQFSLAKEQSDWAEGRGRSGGGGEEELEEEASERE